MDGGPGHLPGPFLTDVGKGRMGRFRRGAVLEHYEGGVWVAHERFGSARDASAALDAIVASGGDPDHLRVGTVGSTLGRRLATILAAVAVGLVVAFWLFIMLGGS
jgi:hypothetical protein